MLITNNIEPYHWAIAGVLLSVITLLLLWMANKRLGISTGFENLCSLIVKAPYFMRTEIISSHGWRLPFLAGLIIGGALSAIAGGGWSPTWNLGMFDTIIRLGTGGKLIWMFIGGLFIGIGTRMAGGCTSGHGIFGLSNLEPSGFISTLCYLVAGVVTTTIIYRIGVIL